jgi:pyruvate/2-oxoglutarate dehydrogenase complex dihydrolipoamide dehydrogenase (E3) component
MAEQLVVIGAGAAGCSAALEAAKLGLKVTLVDEHPQSLQAISLDAPYFYGARLPAILEDSSAISDRVLGANELLLECLEAGVEILTATCGWGSFRPGANNTHLASPQLGLADGERSWIVEYENLILAPGSRDLVLSFPGWNLPGVLGANGAAALLARYQVLPGSRMVILGSGNLALRIAKLALAKGIEIAAIVEAAPHLYGDAALARELAAAGVPLLTGRTIEGALGEQEVQGVRLVGVDGALQLIAGSGEEIACDTICMAFGAVPNVELAALTGCHIEFDGRRGGWVPALDGDFRSSVANVFVVGDGAGVSDAMHLDPLIAIEQGRRAARAVAGSPISAGTAPAIASDDAMLATARDWLGTLVKAGGMDVMVCQCEEVSRRALLDVSPPTYLGAGNMRSNGGVGALSPAGRTSQDLLKRMTRAGMGHCQGKRCRDQVLMLLAQATGTDLAQLVPGSYRAPVRPLPLNVLWAGDETQAMRKTWPIWLHPVEEGAPGYASARSLDDRREEYQGRGDKNGEG